MVGHGIAALLDGKRKSAEMSAGPAERHELVQECLNGGGLLAGQPTAGNQERAFAQHTRPIQLLVRP